MWGSCSGYRAPRIPRARGSAQGANASRDRLRRAEASPRFGPRSGPSDRRRAGRCSTLRYWARHSWTPPPPHQAWRMPGDASRPTTRRAGVRSASSASDRETGRPTSATSAVPGVNRHPAIVFSAQKTGQIAFVASAPIVSPDRPDELLVAVIDATSNPHGVADTRFSSRGDSKSSGPRRREKSSGRSTSARARERSSG